MLLADARIAGCVWHVESPPAQEWIRAKEQLA
jgi:hypothetical protein